MSRTALLLAAVALLPSPLLTQKPDSVALGWQQLVQRLPQASSAAARMINSTYARSGLPLTYWVKDSVLESGLQELVIYDHPCGSTAFVKAARIPPQDARLEAERIVELNSAGNELRRWYVPVDSWPLGLRGNQLLVNIHAGDRRDVALLVGVDGSYSVVPFEQTGAPEIAECPPYNGFGESAYVRCSRFGGRLLVYEGPCT